MSLRLGLGIHVGLVRALRTLRRRARQLASRPLRRRPADRLHVGSGPLVREGWTNIDMDPHPGVDYVLDVRGGLPFRDVRHIYAEHFIEHLTFDEAVRFLKDCRGALRPDGVLRLSTPNLDWVWQTHYRERSGTGECFGINKAFRGWGHQFLYNTATLEATLRLAGFAEVTPCGYGESSDPDLRDLERHERSLDTPSLPHVIVVEARGMAASHDAELERLIDDYDIAVN